MKKQENYFLEKKYFYVSELNMGLDGLESVVDYWGPYNTLKSAQKSFKKYVINDKFLNHWDYAVRGPSRLVKGVDGKSTYKSIWYSDGTLKRYN